MFRRLNHHRPFAKTLFHRKAERNMSRALVGLLAAIGAVGVMIFVRELPSLRRFMRIERM